MGANFIPKNIRGDRSTDLAIIILDHKGPFPTLTLGDSDAMEIGDRVLAVGAPFGLTGSVTSGIISAKGRNGLKMNQYEDFLQTDAAINPGNSGGPLVNLDGQVVGINAAIKSRSGGFQGVGLAAASNLAKRVVMALRTEGIVRRGYLGVQIRELSADVATRLKVPDEAGIAVAQVFENTPAARGGLRDGDIIIELAGKRIKDANSFQRLVAYLPLKQAVEIQVLRDRQPLALNVTVEEQPKEFSTIMAPAPRRPVNIAAGLPLTKLGMDIAELSDTSAEDLGFRGVRGVLITRVTPDSIAADAGLKNGMLITKIEDRAMTTAAQVRDAVEAVPLARWIAASGPVAAGRHELCVAENGYGAVIGEGGSAFFAAPAGKDPARAMPPLTRRTAAKFRAMLARCQAPNSARAFSMVWRTASGGGWL